MKEDWRQALSVGDSATWRCGGISAGCCVLSLLSAGARAVLPLLRASFLRLSFPCSPHPARPDALACAAPTLPPRIVPLVLILWPCPLGRDPLPLCPACFAIALPVHPDAIFILSDCDSRAPLVLLPSCLGSTYWSLVVAAAPSA